MARLARCAVLAAALASSVARCRPSETAPSQRGRRALSQPLGRWTGDAPRGLTVRVQSGHYLSGAVRRTDRAEAAPPHPARPFVAAARVPDGWRFATADGAVFSSRDFLGPLTVVGGVPSAARPLGDGLQEGSVRAIAHRGALAFLDAEGHAWSIQGTSARRLPLEHVLDVLFVSPTCVLALTAPGALVRSDDGGASFAPVPLLPDETPLSLGLVDDTAVLVTTRRRVALDEAGRPRERAPAPSYLDFLRASPAPLGAVPVRLLPDDPSRVAALPDGTLALVEGGSLRVVDPTRGLTLRTTPLPAQDCSVYAARAGVRLVCLHEGWARAVYASTPDGSWTILRDELRAEPMGAVAFDDRTDAWMVAAPCRQQPRPDPTSLCVYRADGLARPVFAPFAARLVDLHHGAALIVAATGSPSLTRASIVRGEAMTALSVPLGPEEALSLRWSGDALSAWGHDAQGRLTLYRAEVNGHRVGPWQRLEVPPEARRVVRSRDAVYSLGRDASALWRSEPSGGFQPLPSPVRGDARALALDPEAPGYCAGAVCRLAGVLEFTEGVEGEPWFLTRPGLAPPSPPPWRPAPMEARARPFYACSLGSVEGPGPELDRGVAVSGYALHWSREPEGFVVRWEGDLVRGSVRGAWPAGEPSSSVLASAPVGARAPMALFSRCAEGGCDRRWATPRGLVPLTLPSPERALRTDLVLAEGGRVMALTRGVTQGRAVVHAGLIEPSSGRVLASRTVACEGPPERALPGSLDGADGVWSPVDARRWRFVPLQGEATETYVEDPGVARACAVGAPTRGVLRRLEGSSEVRGEGWAPIAEEWQLEELLELTAQGLCVRSLAGGESRDESAFERRGTERDPVRSFSLASDGAGGLVGSAWHGRQRLRLTCGFTPGVGRARW